jgi:hypothetical protein
VQQLQVQLQTEKATLIEKWIGMEYFMLAALWNFF